jgi:hypothetical protein
MRRSSAVVTALLVGLAAVVGPASSTAPAPVTAKPASYAFLKTQVFSAPGLGSIAVGMPTEKVVKVQTQRADGSWTRPRVLFRKAGVTCGAIDGRTSPGGVALLLECDTPYYEDTAPAHSMAFATRDLTTWASSRLRGEAYQDPAISADGRHAAWLYGAHGQYRLWSATTGFSTGRTGFDHDSGGETVVVDDAGTVTVMGPDGTGDGCELGVWDKPLAGPQDRYVIAGVDPGCTEGGVDNVDDRTVVAAAARAYRFVVTRVPGERWRLTGHRPVDEPTLVRYEGPRSRVIGNIYAEADGQPLVSLGSPDRRRVHAQVYDDATRTWGPATLAYTDPSARCRDAGNHLWEPYPRVHAVKLRCGRRVVLLTSGDSTTWTATRIDDRPYALSKSRALLAAAGPRSITVVAPGGTQIIRRNAPGRCDFVFPIAGDSVLRLHGGRSARWPTRLQKSQAGGRWRTIQTVRMPRTGTCADVDSQHDLSPSAFFLRGDGQYVSLRVRRGGSGGWYVERFSY